MSAHLAVVDSPVRAVRPEALGMTGLGGLPGRRSTKRSDLRTELRNAFFRSTGKHRSTFIPLGADAVRFD